MGLSSTSGEFRTSQLRLAASRHRITAFISQIGELEASNFPHKDGKEALSYIRSYSEKLLQRLDIPPDRDPGVIDSVCQQITLAVQQYTQILGFILRSTNVRNPFELHYPLKRLLQNVVGKHAKLLISAEWNFVPFTYPMNLGLLPGFALVGIPAPESGNVLVTPLAGHEIGHSAWQAHNLKPSVEQSLLSAIESTMDDHPHETDRIIESLKLGPLGRQRIRQGCLDAGIMQLEEIFCDAFGLQVFGASYLYAFEYFLAPGGGGRSLGYPSDAARIRFLQQTAEHIKIAVDQPLFERWLDSVPDANVNADFMLLIDLAVGKASAEVIQRAIDLLKDKRIPLPAEDSINRAKAAFGRGEPDASRATLPELVTAGWLYIREREGLSGFADRTHFLTLADLMLKSVEVSEFLIRISEDA